MTQTNTKEAHVEHINMKMIYVQDIIAVAILYQAMIKTFIEELIIMFVTVDFGVIMR